MNTPRSAMLALLALAACNRSAPEPAPRPAPRPTPAAPSTVTLRREWSTVVVMERDDSIVLTLPDGNRQTQRQTRTARFTMTLTPGAIRVSLDALTLRPALGDVANEVVGTTWTGRVSGSGRISSLQASRGTPLAEELGGVVETLLPRLADGTVRPGLTWSDSASGPVRVDIFRGTEHRSSRWTSGERTLRDGVEVIPVRVRESYEQLGRGSQSGRQMTMTAQGRRIGTYYVTLDGRIDAATMQDSVAKFITIADTRQSIPTMQYARTSFRYGSATARD